MISELLNTLLAGVIALAFLLSPPVPPPVTYAATRCLVVVATDDDKIVHLLPCSDTAIGLAWREI